MSDDITPEHTEQQDPLTQPSSDRPAAAATPAARARRIGGRPMPFPQADADAPPKSEKRDKRETVAAPPDPISTRKPARGAETATPSARDRRRETPADLALLHRRLDRLRWVPAVIAGLAVVAMLVVGAWQAHGVWWGKRLGDTRAQQQQQVLATAKTCAAAVLSYDYRNLGKAQQAAESCITPQFKDQYEQTFAVVKQLAPQKKATITFQVANGGVQSVSKDGSQWVVLLYGQSSYADSSTKGNPRLDVSSPIVTLTKVDGKYLVSNLNTS